MFEYYMMGYMAVAMVVMVYIQIQVHRENLRLRSALDRKNNFRNDPEVLQTPTFVRCPHCKTCMSFNSYERKPSC